MTRQVNCIIGINIMKLKNPKSAFTLIELIVSMSIIIMLTVLFLVNYRQSNQRTDLTMTTQVMIADIHLAQANALGLIKYNSSIPSGGWGLFCSSREGDNNRYVIFADINDNHQYDEGEADPNLGGKIVMLPKNIFIDSFYMENSSSSDLSISFIPPDPITVIFDGANEKKKVQIILKESVNNTTKNIVVYFTGLVDIVSD